MENNTKSVTDNIWLGLALGLIIPFLTLIFVNADWQHNISFFDFLKRMYDTKALSGLLSLCVLPNLLVFYLFLRKDKYKTVRGIVTAVILFSLLVFSLKFFL